MMAANPNEIHVDLSLLQTVFILIAMLVGWLLSLWKMAKTNAKKETDLYAAIELNKHDINEVGARINTTSLSCGKHDEAIQSLKIEQQQSRDDRMNMRERIATNFTAIGTLQDALAQERLAVMATLHANEKAAAERDAVTRESLASIRERLNIEQIVNTVVRNLKVIA